jgi:hypothetical protein
MTPLRKLWKCLSVEEKCRFKQLFGVDFDLYYQPLPFGFDVVRFDEEVVKAGDESMLKVAKEKFGEEATALMQKAVRGY